MVFTLHQKKIIKRNKENILRDSKKIPQQVQFKEGERERENLYSL
jgi:hypothetical protein